MSLSTKKRFVEEEARRVKRGSGFSSHTEIKNEDNLVFEDPFGDDLEDEEMIESDEDMEGVDDRKQLHDELDQEQHEVKRVFLPGVDSLDEDEVLDYDASAYDMYYAMTAEWPSLSFDIMKDTLGDCRTRFPMTIFVVAGTQASKPENNQLTVMKLSDLHKTKHSEDSDEEDESDDDMDGDPVLESRSIPHIGGVNRVRSMPQASNIVATWSDTQRVYLWDVTKQLASLEGKTHTVDESKKEIFSFSGHAGEGFAMDWSPVHTGKLLTGDCSRYIYLWSNVQSSWKVDKIPFTGHRLSVEDLQWSPTEATVFASCSSDRTVRIWDTRRKAGSMIDVVAHEDDVNVISWNRNVAYLLASGSDDGSFKVWDLRNLKQNSPVAHFRYHTAPVTSIEWHHTDESVLAVSGADNQISVWDMSVEEDTDSHLPENQDPKVDLPPQLLFVHQGQTDIKELHFHPQCPGVLVSTASDGFNVFKPANIS